MKICVVTTSFPRGPQDDRGTFVWESARGVQALGVDVRVVAIHSPGARTHEYVEGIPIYRPRYLWPERLELLQTEGGGLPVVLRSKPLAWLALPSFFGAQAVAAARYARDCDLIHAHWTLSAAASLSGAAIHRCPVVVTVQGSDIYEAGRMPVIRSVTRQILKGCRKIVCLSQSLAGAAAAMGADRAKITVVPNGVDIHKFSPLSTAREPLLLAAGSLIERKGVRFLIEAMPEIVRQMPGHRLTIIGTGPQRAELEALAQALGVAPYITWAGIQTHDQVRDWMRRASVFIMPSLEEALGQVLLEALASGTPCIGTLTGGIPDVISPDVGILVPAADPSALSQAAIELLGDPARRTKMGEQARKRAVEQFSTERAALRLVEIYKEVVSER